MKSKKVLREGRKEDILESEWREALTTCCWIGVAAILIMVLVTALYIYDCIPDSMPNLAKLGKWVGKMTVADMLGCFSTFISLGMFAWYWRRRNSKYYLADFPDYCYEHAHLWMIVILLYALPVLAVSYICMRKTRDWRAELDQATMGGYFVTAAQYDRKLTWSPEAVTAHKKQARKVFANFCEYCHDQQKLPPASRPSAVKMSPNLASRVKLIPISRQKGASRIRKEALRGFDDLWERPEVMNITAQCDFILSRYVVYIYVKSRVSDDTTGTMYNMGDYRIHVRPCGYDIELLRSGMSANGKVNWPGLDNYRLTLFGEKCRQRFHETMQKDGVAAMINEIIDVMNSKDCLPFMPDDLGKYYVPAVDVTATDTATKQTTINS